MQNPEFRNEILQFECINHIDLEKLSEKYND